MVFLTRHLLLVASARTAFTGGVYFAVALAILASGSQAQEGPTLTPPAVTTKVDAVYAADAPAVGREARVVVRITVGTDGTVSDAEVIESAGPSFNSAALAAVRQWRFRPAMRGDQPVSSRIRIPFLFAPPTRDTTAINDGGTPSPDVLPGADAGVVASLLPVTPAAAPADAEIPDGGERVLDVTVLGRARVASRGTSDYQIEVAQLAQVPHANAVDYLKLAPGVLLTNEAGEGHAEQVFLRGFDAREGQDIEFSVDGVPVNESGNLHGNGYSDTHFIIPELVEGLRILEGPFDPRQGNYAVAGSADFHLGLADRGLLAKLSYGSFKTSRILVAYGPPGSSSQTFAAAELFQTDGFGRNRDGRRGSAIAQYEGRTGSHLYRVTAQAYSASFHAAGVLRDDDYRAGRVGFFDSYDSLQGEDAARYSLAAALESRTGPITFNNQIFGIFRPLRIRENFTGFLLDVQLPLQNPHGQRGDLIDLNVSEVTLGARGFGRLTTRWLNQPQEIELGYFARHDIASSLQQRIEAATGHPYLTETNYDANLDDIGIYADANLRLLRWLAIRGGARGDLFVFKIHDLCAVHSVEHPSPSNPPGDASCLSQQNFGAHREPDQFASTASSSLMPRVSVLVGPWAGLSASASFGRGIRSIDPIYITQDKLTPFAGITAIEAGLSYQLSLAPGVQLALGSTGFRTSVDQDLIFSQTVGRTTLAGSTTRIGSANALRLSGAFFDLNLNATYVRATFDDTHLLIPYIPDLVIREDGAIFHDLPWSFLRIAGAAPRATLAVGATYVGPRPLPFGVRSDRIFTIDTNLLVGWPFLQVGLSATNLLNTQYRLGEYNYASDFHSRTEPTLVPVRHFTAGAPRALLLTLTVKYGGTS